MLRTLAKACRFKFCSTATVTGPVPEPAKEKPKWMRFFEGQDPIKIDLERSMKSENVDLIQNYVKQNYIQFQNSQLVQIIPKIARSQVFERVRGEIKLRIVGSNFSLSAQESYQLLLSIEEFNIIDSLIVCFTLAEVSQNFFSYDHIQQSKVIALGLKLNKISLPQVYGFLDFFPQNLHLFPDAPKEENSSEELKSEVTNKLDPLQFTQYLQVISQLKDVLYPEDFSSRLSSNVLLSITNIYLEKLEKLEENCEIVSQMHFDKIFSPEILNILTYQQKITFKKILVKLLELRFDNETMLGKYGFYKNDKGATAQKALGAMRAIIQTGERELVEKVLILIGNQIMSREISDFKFDFRLFSYLTKYQYAYKYYVDESFISMKSLLRSLIFNSKKLSDENEHTVFHVVFQKYKSYNDLNYSSILKQSEDVYTRKVDFSDSMINQWNQLQKDIQICLRDYLTQQVASGVLNKLMSRFKSSSAEKMDEEQISEAQDADLLVVEENEAASSSKRNDKTNNGNYKNEDKNYFSENSGDNKTIQDEDYKRQVGNKLLEFQVRFQNLNLSKIASFNTRIPYQDTLLLRYIINATECIAQNLYSIEPTEEFLFAVKMWVKQDKLEEVFDHFGMIPSFLESLILIEAYGKIVKNQNWFSKELTNKIFNVKHQLDTLLQSEPNFKNRKPKRYIEIIEKEVEQLESKKLPLDKAYDQHDFLFEIINNSYSVSKEQVEYQKQITEAATGGKIRMQQKRDLLTSQFVPSKENILRKALHSSAFVDFVNESHLKKYTGEILFDLTAQTQKNVVFFPFYADFVLPNKKIVVQVLEKNKLIDGVENTISGFQEKNDIFLKKIGYSVVYIEYKDFEIDPRSFQKNILKKICNILPSTN